MFRDVLRGTLAVRGRDVRRLIVGTVNVLIWVSFKISVRAQVVVLLVV